MITNPNAKTVLCYGDCNVHGYISLTEKRYPANIRWPGVLQNILGNNYYIIEEGLTRRNTGFNDPKYIGMEGSAYLVPCLLSHNPLDWVIFWLSTRDHYDNFLVSPNETAINMRNIIKITKQYAFDFLNKPSKILLIAPTLVTEDIKKFSNRYNSAIEKSKLISKLYKSVSYDENIFFLDASKVTDPSKEDGMHLTPEGHHKIAMAISKIIKI